MDEIFVELFAEYPIIRMVVGWLLVIGGGVFWLFWRDEALIWAASSLIITAGLLLIGFALRGSYRRMLIGCLLILGAGWLWLTRENAVQGWWSPALMIASALLLIGFTVRRRRQQERLQMQHPYPPHLRR